MWKPIKSFLNIFSDESGGDIDSDALKRIVTEHGINRRKNARINYPRKGAIGPFPAVYYKQKPLNVANISVGGLLIFDSQETLGSEVGETLHLDLVWPDFKTQMRSRIVGAVLKRRHIQFTDFNAQAFVRISELIKPGYIGQRFYKVDDAQGKLESLEMWIGPRNETLVFLDGEILAEYNCSLGKILLPANKKPFHSSTNTSLASKDIQDFFVQLSNFPSPSPRLIQLIESVERWIQVDQKNLQTKLRSGTDG